MARMGVQREAGVETTVSGRGFGLPELSAAEGEREESSIRGRTTLAGSGARRNASREL